MLTTKEWFDYLPKDLRDKAVRYTRKAELTTKHKTFKDAISCSFLWGLTPEEFDFWYEVSKGNYGEIQTPVL